MTTVNLVAPIDGDVLGNTSSSIGIQVFVPGGAASGATMQAYIDGMPGPTLTDYGGSGWQVGWEDYTLGVHTIQISLDEGGTESLSALITITVEDTTPYSFVMPDVRNMTEAEARAALLVAGAPLGQEPPFLVTLWASFGTDWSDEDVLGETGLGYAYAETRGPDGTVSYQGQGIGAVITPSADSLDLDLWGLGPGMVSGPHAFGGNRLILTIDEWLQTPGAIASSFIPGGDGGGGGTGETSLVWDAAGSRRYETGIDRGVIYPPEDSGLAAPWNGLIGVSESVSREVKSYYIDGIKYLDHQVLGAYSATLQAFTYPDVLDKLTGLAVFSPGVFLHDQRARVFSLSYRTVIGNDIDGIDHAHKLHIIYNVLASSSGSVSFATIGDSIVPNVFEWSLTATPPNVAGIRPTSHISIHTDSIDPALLTLIEAQLYGTADTLPDLPNMAELLTMITDFYT